MCGSKSRKYETFRDVHFLTFSAALAPLDCSNQSKFQVSESDGFQSGDPIENDYYDDDIFEEPSDDEDSESLNDTYPSSDFEPNFENHIPPAIRYQRASSASLSRSSGRRSRLVTATEPSESSITKSSKITSSYASNTPRTANSANSSNADSGIAGGGRGQKEIAEIVKPQYNSFVVSPPESDLYNTELKSTSRPSGAESESETRSTTRSETVTETVTNTNVSETVNTETGILIGNVQLLYAI